MSVQPSPDVRTGFRIRPLRPDDLSGVMEIENVSFSTPWKESTFRGLMVREDTDLLVAEQEGRVLGYAACWSVVDQAELGNVAVAPEARRAGVGRALVQAVSDAVRERGAAEVFLEVRVSNLDAQRLYRDLGFEVVGRRTSYYTRPLEDALVMRRRIVDFPEGRR